MKARQIKVILIPLELKEQARRQYQSINTAIASWDEVVTSPTDSTVINLVAREEVEESYSDDNNLASLAVEGLTLSPEFNKDTTSYTCGMQKVILQVLL